MITLVCILFGLLILIKLYWVLTNKKCESNVCLLGKTALVTGGNSGIGYQIVLNLLSRGCRVIVADNTEDPELNKKLFKETHSKNFAFKYVELTSFKSVRELANNLKNSEEKLDILINNAGVGRINRTTEDGLDATMQINYFSHFLLTHLLIDLLKKSPSRIIFTASLLAFFNNLSVEAFRRHRHTMLSYANSKACAIIVADLFAEKLKRYNIRCNSYHPYIVRTNIFALVRKYNKNITDYFGTFFLEIMSFLVGKNVKDAVETATYLACANEVDGVTGEFFGEMKPILKPGVAQNKKFCSNIWKASEDIVGLENYEKL